MAIQQTIDPHLTTPVTVTRMAGAVTVIDAQGNSRELNVGDQIQPGEKIMAAANSGVMLLLPDGSMLPVGNMPSVQSADDDVANLEDQPEQAPLVYGDDEALIAKAQTPDKADAEDAKAKHAPEEDLPKSSSVTEDTAIAMDMSQVNPDMSSTTDAVTANADFTSTEDHLYGDDRGVDSKSGSALNTALNPTTVNFVNFTPTIIGGTSGTAKEDITLTSTGTLQISDQNSGDSATVTMANGKGAFGSMAIDAQGHWAYQLDNNNAQVQALGEGEYLTERFMVTVTDIHGASVDKQITITVDGSNDKPVISGVHSGDINEGNTREITGALAQTDKDTTDTHSWSVDPAQTAQHGTFSIDQNGQWHYKLDNTDPAVNTLAHGQQLTETINVKVADNHGGETTQQVTVTINGTNADPVIGGTFSGKAIEDKTTTVSDKLTVTDTDATDTHTFGVDNPQGAYGRLAVDPNTGQWTYVLDHARADSLSATDHRLEQFNVTVIDHNGGRATHQLTIDVAGSNDKPVISAIAAQSVNEGDPDLNGQIKSTDVDTGDTATYSTSFKHAGFTLNPDGTYTLNLADKSFDHLAAGEQEKLSIPVTVKDAQGGTDTQILEITVHGTNDLPTINPIAAVSVAEGSAVFTGQLSSTDVDATDTATYSTISTQAGFTLDVKGAYSIDPTNPVFDHLAVGQTQQLTIPVTVTDNNGDTSTTNIEVTITGTNDKPVIGSVAATTVAEGSSAFSGQLMATDVDTGDMFTYSSTSTQAGFTLQPDGSYTVDPTDPAFDHLAVGQTQQLTIPVTVTDNNGGTSTTNIEVTITGTNDKPVIGSVAATTVAEGSTAFSGQLTATDVDTGDTLTYSSTSTQAGFTLQPDGAYSIDPTDPAFDHLSAGQSQLITIPVTVTDNSGGSSTTNIEVTITGTNDNAVISSSVVTVTEDMHQSATIHLGISDIDTGEDHFKAGTLAGAHGTATLAADGTLVYTLNNAAAQYLNAGQSITDTIKVTSADGTTHDVAVTINGTNDNPVINAITAQSANEDGSTVSGKITSTDVDTGDTATYASTATPAGFVLNPDGSYTLDPGNAAYQHLAVGETKTISIPVTATDSHGGISTTQNLVITITGTNDIPVVSAPVTLPAGTEDLTQTITAASLLANATDVDSSDKLSISGAVTADHGTVSGPDASGAYHFTPDPDYNGAVKFTYDITDSNGGSVQASATTTLAAVDDLIVDSGARDLGNTDEDNSQHISEAQLLQNLHDVDGTLQVVGTPSSAHGTVSVDPAGGFIFTPAANYHGPAELSYQVTDGTTQYSKTASLDVVSVTDVAKVDLSMMAEQTIVKYDPSQVASGQVPYIEQTVSKQSYREFSFEMTFVGSKSIPDGANLAGLRNGDPLGVWDPKDLSISLGGNQHRAGIHLNDGNDHRVTVTWESQSGDLKIFDNGQLLHTFPDVMKGQVFQGGDNWIIGALDHNSGSLNSEITNFSFASKAVTEAQVASAPLYNVLQGDHSMQTDIRAVNGVITDLASSHQPASTVTVEHKIIDVHTMIPAPGSLLHISASAVATAPDDKVSKLEISGLLKGTIISDGQGNTHTISSMSDKVDIHNWNLSSLTAQLPAGMMQNMNVTLVATTVAPDGKEAVATNSEAVILDPASPIPNAQISGDDNKATDEDHSVSGVLHVTDSDASQAHFDTAPVNGKYGQLTMTADGHWVFTPNAVANALNDGDKVNDILSVKSADGTTHQVIINITGSNDAPVINNVVNQSAIEDGKTLSGHLVATDVDSGDQLTFSATASGLPAGMTLEANGNYSLDPSNAAYQKLAAGETQTLVVPVQVTDSHGATDTTNITIVITGTNDIPSLSVVPDTGNPQLGSLQATDVDTTDTLSYSVVNASGQFGSLSIDPTTHQYSYTQAQSVAGMNYDKSTQTYSGKDVFEVKVSDGHGGETSKFITFDVSGQVSAPTPGNPGVPVVQTATTTPTIGNTAPPVTTTPAANASNTVTIDLLAGSDSGASTKDNITKDTTPTVSGQTDIPFSKVEIIEGGKVIASTTSDASGNYSVTTPALTDATHNLIAQATAPSASAAVSSSPLNIIVDTQIDAGTVDVTDGGNSDGVINLQEAGSAKITGKIDPSASLSSLEITDSSGNKVSVPASSVSVDQSKGQYVATVDVSSLSDGKLTVTANATDVAGNSASTTDSITLDTALPPVLPTGAISAPMITNNTAPTMTVNVPTGSVPAGTTIQTTIPATTPGGQPTVINTAVPAGGGPVVVQLPTLPQGTVTPSVQLVTPSGNTSPAVTAPSVTVDTTPPTISIDAIDTDNVINAAEHKTDLTISGKTDAENGQSVTVNVAGTDYTATVANGSFSVTVPATTVAGFTDGQSLAVSAIVTDKAGNTASPASANIDVDTTASIAIDAISTDNVINAAEHNQPLIISGTVTGVENGRTVDVLLNGHNYAATVANGSFTTTVPAADVKALATGSTDVGVSVIDQAGNTAIDIQKVAITDAYSGTAATVDITDGGNTDNIINASEKTNAVVTGHIDPGSTLTQLEITDSAGTKHSVDLKPGSVTVDNAGNYTVHNVDVSSLTDGKLTVSATATDSVGNVSSATDSITLDTFVPPVLPTGAISVPTITNNTAPTMTVNVPTGSVPAGTTIQTTIPATTPGGQPTVINTAVPAGGGPVVVQLPTLPQGTVTPSVQLVTSSGNTSPAVTAPSVTVDTSPPTISIDAIDTDNVINAAEHKTDLTISGKTDAENGQSVTVNVDGTDYKATVANGTFSVTVPAATVAGFTDGQSLAVSASVTDKAGNTANPANAAVSVDLNAAASITVDSITADNVINAAESGGKVTVTGSVGGDVKDGDKVALTVNGNTVEATVSGGKYAVDIAGSDLKADSNIKASVTATDAAGNTRTATTDHAYSVDTQSTQPTSDLTDATDTGFSQTDNITNIPQPVIKGSAEAGATVVISDAAGNTVATTTANAQGAYSVQTSKLSEGSHNLTITATDKAGNSASTTQQVQVDTTAPTLALASLAPDTNNPVTQISGAAAGAHEVEVKVIDGQGNAVETLTAQVDASGNWQVDTSSLTDGAYFITPTAIDAAGNRSALSGLGSFNLDTAIQAPTAGLSAATDSGSSQTDGITNVKEPTLEGKSEANSTVEIKDALGNVVATTKADANGDYTVKLTGLAEGSHDLSVIATDAAGNSASTQQKVIIDNTVGSPVITITTDSDGDNFINAAEYKADNNGISMHITMPQGTSIGDTLDLTAMGLGKIAIDQTILNNGYDAHVTTSMTSTRGTLEVGGQIVDQAGNVSAMGTAKLGVDFAADKGNVDVSRVTGDDLIDGLEMAHNVKIEGYVKGGDTSVGDTVSVEINGQKYSSTLVQSGSFSEKKYSIEVDPKDLKADPDFKVEVYSTDNHGNPVVSTSTDHTVTFDTTTTVDANLETGSDSGVSHSDKITNVTTPTIVGQAEAGATVVITDKNGQQIGTGTAGSNGTYSIVTSQLAEGSNDLTVTSTDLAGNTARASLSVTIDTSVNANITVDPVTADNLVNATEAGATVTITGTVGGDVKDGDTVTVQAGGYDHRGIVSSGTFAIDVPGSHLENANQVNASVSTTDSAGNTTTATDKQTYSVDTTASATDDVKDVTEDQTAAVSGNVLSNDADAVSLSTTGDIAGKYGSFHLNSDGSYNYTLDNSKPEVQALAPSSAPLTDSVSYTAVDDHGNKVTANLNINIHGSIDAPTLTTSHEATHFNPIDAVVDGVTNANADLSAYIVSGSKIESSQGHLDLSRADASLVSEKKSNVGVNDPAGPGAKYINLDETLLIHLQGESRSAVITLSNFSSKSTSTGAYAGRSDDRMHWIAYDKNGVKVDEGDYDPQKTDIKSSSTASISTAAPYTYLAIQALHNPDPNVGEARFTLKHFEAPLIAYETKVNFDAVLGDAKGSETLSYKVTGLDATSGFDHGTKNPDGSWTISATDAADLRVHHTGSLDLMVQAMATDGTVSASSAPVALRIDGATGAQYELISGVHSGQTTENEQKPVQGDLGIDTTAPGVHEFVSQTTTTKYGTFTLAANGHWSYQPNQAGAQALARGDMQHEVFKVETNNGISRDVTVDIRGLDDASVIGGRLGSVTEDKAGQTQASGQLTATDVDTDVNTLGFKSVTEHGSYGDLTIQKDGSWIYTLDPAKADSLAAGQVAHESFAIIQTDKATGYALSSAYGYVLTSDKLEITVNGSNDAAVIGGVHTGSVVEDGTLTVSGKLTIADIDTGEDHFVAQTNVAGSNGYGHFSIDASGQWSYVLDNNSSKVQSLNASDNVKDTLIVSSADGTTHQITVDVQGQYDNNPAVITGQDAGSVKEDSGTGMVSGTLNISDSDTGEAALQATLSEIVSDNGYGKFIVSQSGTWIYTLDNSNADVQKLNDGDTLSDTLTVHSVDGTAHQITVTINGTDDNHAPVVQTSSVLLSEVREDGATDTVSGHLDATDVDGDSLSYQIDPSSQMRFGSLSIDANGQWSYQLDNSNARVDALNTGQSLTDYARVQISDGHGGVVEKDISIMIRGSDDNHAAVISGQDSGNVREDGSLTVSGQLDVTDQDGRAEELLQSQSSAAGKYGSFQIYADGFWEYQLDNNSRTVQNLNDRDHVQDTITVKSADGTPHVITVDIQGADENHAPVISAFSGATSWRRPYEWTGQVDATDADRGDRLSYSLPGGHNNWRGDEISRGRYGSLTLEANGDLTYRVDSRVNTRGMDHLQGRGNNDKEGREYFEIEVTDKQGNTDTKYIEFTVHSKHDGKSAYVYSQSETDYPPSRATVNDEAQADNALIIEQVNIDLADAHQQIAAAAHEINVLAAQGGDTTEAQAQLDEFTAIKESLTAELTVLDSAGQDAIHQEPPLAQPHDADTDASATDETAGHDEPSQPSVTLDAASDADLAALVAGEETTLDFTHLPDPSQQTAAEATIIEQEASPLNAGDVLDSTLAGDVDILHAVDKLDPSKPDAVDKAAGADKADTSADSHDVPDASADDLPDVMPDRAALDAQLVEPPDEHQQ